MEDVQGANQAAAAAKLGCTTAMVGQVGSDWGADFMLSNLQGQGVQIEGTVRKLEKQATGTALVMLLPSGENSIIIVGGANTASWDISQRQKVAILDAELVLLQREIPDSVNLQVAQMCKEAGVDVILDAGGAEGPLGEDLLSCLSLLSPNETELARMTEMEINSLEDVLAACKKLRQQGANDILVKLGSQGSMLVTSTDASASYMPHNVYQDLQRCGEINACKGLHHNVLEPSVWLQKVEAMWSRTQCLSSTWWTQQVQGIASLQRSQLRRCVD
jgi:ribokinase